PHDRAACTPEVHPLCRNRWLAGLWYRGLLQRQCRLSWLVPANALPLLVKEIGSVGGRDGGFLQGVLGSNPHLRRHAGNLILDPQNLCPGVIGQPVDVELTNPAHPVLLVNTTSFGKE